MLLALLLLTTITLRISYQEENITVGLAVGPYEKQLLPGKEEGAEKKENKRGKVKNDKPGRASGINQDQIQYLLHKAPPVIKKIFSRLRRRTLFCPLKIHVLLAGEDPADTAVLYGRIQGLLAAVMPRLHERVQIQEQDIQLQMDFVGEKTKVDAEIGVSLWIWDVLVILLCAGVSALKLLIGFRRRSTPEETGNTPHMEKETRAPAGPQPGEAADMCPGAAAEIHDEENKHG